MFFVYGVAEGEIYVGAFGYQKMYKGGIAREDGTFEAGACDMLVRVFLNYNLLN
jgi:hypothetical protein